MPEVTNTPNATPQDIEDRSGNVGGEESFDDKMQQYRAAGEEASARNVEMMIAGVEVGTDIKASQQRATPL